MSAGLYTGKFESAVDAKGRVSMPQSYRAIEGQEASEICLLKWRDHALLFHRRNLDKVVGHVAERLSLEHSAGVKSFFNPKLMQDRRYFFSNLLDLDFDAQGRLTIPKPLRIQLDYFEDVVWLGCGEYVELWAKKHYEADCARWEEAGGYEDLFNALPLPNNPSAQHEGSSSEGDDWNQA